MKCPVCNKNISNSALKCPYCKTRVGLLCSHCNTVNPVGNFVCKKCGQDLLKVCSHCNSVNFPSATKCRKCGLPFGQPVKKTKSKQKNKAKTSEIEVEKPLHLGFVPIIHTREEAFTILSDGILDKDKKIFSITGDKGIGKSTLLFKLIEKFEKNNLQWCIGKCTPLTQLTPGGVIQDMLLNLFNLPTFCINNEEMQNDAVKFFSNEFKFLNSNEISLFINFLYNFQDGDYEDIIINKRKTYSILMQIFDAFVQTGRFVFVIDNFDFIDGFSVEFLNHFMQKDENWKNLKFIALYNEHRPISGFFGFDNRDIKSYVDINLAPLDKKELVKCVKSTGDAGTYVTKREVEVILEKSGGNPAFVEQAVNYSFDCQISDKAFILPNSFSELIKARLAVLNKNNNSAYRVLCGASILGDRINLALLKEIFGYNSQEFNDIMSYLAKSGFIRPYSDTSYEFNNLLLWETVLKSITLDISFEDLNVKIGKVISVFTLNTNATMAMIAHNLKENRMAFDIWTKITRLASFVGDINLYVIAQKQCLALLNEFNENETLNIRYNISERLGKLLTEYDPEEALEFLPDAISNAKAMNNDVKEIELLGYLALCCKKTGNYFGDVECVDNVLKKMKPEQKVETAILKTTKISSLIDIGNCGEVISLIDSDIMPVITSFLAKPKMNKSIPVGFMYDTWLRVQLELAMALALQGNDRCFEVLTVLFEIIEKHKINDPLLMCKAKLVLAYANTMKGDFNTSNEILEGINGSYRADVMDSEIISRWNLCVIVNKFMQKQYDGVREQLFESVTFANNTGDSFTKNILKVLLGKMFKDEQQARKAIDIYNQQITYFANEKMALGALLSWYLIAEATIVTENPRSALDIANQALEIAQNPQINNTFFIVLLKIVIAKAYIAISDFESAKISLESAIILAKKYSMNDLLSKLYLLYGKYYQDIGSVQAQNQLELLKGASKMYDKALELVTTKTRNTYIKELIEKQKSFLTKYCEENGLRL